jgi:hypothetical protein
VGGGGARQGAGKWRQGRAEIKVWCFKCDFWWTCGAQTA